MSITNEKLQTIKDNVSKVYRSGQMDVIKNANSLKGFESNKVILLDDVSPVTHEMGARVRGKNLIPYPYTSTTSIISGVTFVVNSEGSITVNGTATANVIFNFESDETMFTLSAGNYFLSGCPSGGNAISYYIAAATRDW